MDDIKCLYDRDCGDCTACMECYQAYRLHAESLLMEKDKRISELEAVQSKLAEMLYELPCEAGERKTEAGYIAQARRECGLDKEERGKKVLF